MIVERERERQAFKKDEYWTIEGLFNKDNQEFDGKLNAIDDKKLKKLDISNTDQAHKIVDDLSDLVRVGHGVARPTVERKAEVLRLGHRPEALENVSHYLRYVYRSRIDVEQIESPPIASR